MEEVFNRDYPEIFRNLTQQTACVVFFKKDGQVRIMFATRNLSTVALRYGYQGYELGGHDRRCNIKNGNFAVFDLALGEARSFHIDRIIDIKYYGEIKTLEELNEAAEKYMEFKENYEKTMPMEVTFDSLG